MNMLSRTVGKNIEIYFLDRFDNLVAQSWYENDTASHFGMDLTKAISYIVDSAKMTTKSYRPRVLLPTSVSSDTDGDSDGVDEVASDGDAEVASDGDAVVTSDGDAVASDGDAVEISKTVDVSDHSAVKNDWFDLVFY